MNLCATMVKSLLLRRHQLTSQILTWLNYSNSYASTNLKKRAPGHTLHPFVCSKRVVVKAGNGGNGCIAFRRVFCNPHCGPSGGDGGNGAHVIFKAVKNVCDLSNVTTIVNGDNGMNGLMDNCHGASADHLYLHVPVGTQIYSVGKRCVGNQISNDNSNNENSSTNLVRTLRKEGDIFLAARGGAGGKGNAFMTHATLATDSMRLPSRKNTPLRIAERGGEGQLCEYILRMSKLADLGFVGCPNAGKSTLLRSLTRARPKVAPYPFTTLQPHIGILNLPENRVNSSSASKVSGRAHSIAIADLPGLIDGAAEYNKGLGIEFLSLIADCSTLAYVIDYGTLWYNYGVNRLNDIENELVNQLSMLYYEVTTYDANLGNQDKCIVLGSKLDLIFPYNKINTDNTDVNNSNSKDVELLQTLHRILYKAACSVGVINDSPESVDQVILISAKRGDNIPHLISKLWNCVQNLEEDEKD
ncbi:hypothetical protein MN116_000739 [Schistosoma mekongi]|uniref:GTP-binding protein n=1 Tax=Schistosoma mekongi TaxID=38744 RepID=A0AAE1ZJT3_SCHME|nr:hypothetical protein MN116_000739 [Schistosoma mekongi]